MNQVVENYGISTYCDHIKPSPEPMMFATLEEAARTLLKELLLQGRRFYLKERGFLWSDVKLIVQTVDDALADTDGIWFKGEGESLSVNRLIERFHEHPSVNLCCQCYIHVTHQVTGETGWKYDFTIHGALQGRKELGLFVATDPNMRKLKQILVALGANGSDIRIKRIKL